MAHPIWDPNRRILGTAAERNSNVYYFESEMEYHHLLGEGKDKDSRVDRS